MLYTMPHPIRKNFIIHWICRFFSFFETKHHSNLETMNWYSLISFILCSGNMENSLYNESEFIQIEKCEAKNRIFDFVSLPSIEYLQIYCSEKLLCVFVLVIWIIYRNVCFKNAWHWMRVEKKLFAFRILMRKLH